MDATAPDSTLSVSKSEGFIFQMRRIMLLFATPASYLLVLFLYDKLFHWGNQIQTFIISLVLGFVVFSLFIIGLWLNATKPSSKFAFFSDTVHLFQWIGIAHMLQIFVDVDFSTCFSTSSHEHKQLVGFILATGLVLMSIDAVHIWKSPRPWRVNDFTFKISKIIREQVRLSRWRVNMGLIQSDHALEGQSVPSTDHDHSSFDLRNIWIPLINLPSLGCVADFKPVLILFFAILSPIAPHLHDQLNSNLSQRGCKTGGTLLRILLGIVVFALTYFGSLVIFFNLVASVLTNTGYHMVDKYLSERRLIVIRNVAAVLTTILLLLLRFHLSQYMEHWWLFCLDFLSFCMSINLQADSALLQRKKKRVLITVAGNDF